MADLVVRTAATEPGVETARVFLLGEDAVLRSVAWHGGPAGSQTFSEIPLSADLPAAVSARTGEPLHAVDMASLYARFPEFGAVAPYPEQHSLHLVPLRIEGSVIGLLALTFRCGVVADDAQREFVTAIGDNLAQAIERGRVSTRIEAERQRSLSL